jgi:catechol 2,3-dioxygenase-like lactoylglutathione lyase family enzyme
MLESATAHGTIAVSDMDRAKRFYAETLGLAIRDEQPGGIRFEAGGGNWFLVYQSEFARASDATSMTFDVDDLDITVKSLREAGVTFVEYDLPGIKTVDGIAEAGDERGAWFKDPDGNILAVGQRI